MTKKITPPSKNHNKNIKKAKSQNKIRIKDTYWISEMLGWEKWRVKKKKQESLH